jgi:hypothetical protein
VTEISSWNETPAGLLANGGWRASDEWLERARLLAGEKRWQRVDYETAQDAADARLAGEGRLIRPWRETREIQRELADRGWTGQWLAVSSSVPPELRPLHDTAKLNHTVGELPPGWRG